MKGSGRGQIKVSIPALSGRTEYTMNFFSMSNRSPGRELNPVPLEYEAVVLTTQPRRSVLPCVNNPDKCQKHYSQHMFEYVNEFQGDSASKVIPALIKFKLKYIL